MFKERELVNTKGVKELQQEECLWDSFIEIVRKLQHSGVEKQVVIINEGSLQSNWVGLPNNPTMTQPIVSNRTSEMNQQPIILKHVMTKKTLEFFKILVYKSWRPNIH